MEWDPAYVPPGTHVKATPFLPLWKKNVIFHQLFANKKVVFIDLWNTVSHAVIFTFVQGNQKIESWH